MSYKRDIIGQVLRNGVNPDEMVKILEPVFATMKPCSMNLAVGHLGRWVFHDENQKVFDLIGQHFNFNKYSVAILYESIRGKKNKLERFVPMFNAFINKDDLYVNSISIDDLEIVQFLVDQGVQFSIQYAIASATRGRFDIVRILDSNIRKSSDASISQKCMTNLQSFEGWVDIIKILLTNGMNPDIQIIGPSGYARGTMLKYLEDIDGDSELIAHLKHVRNTRTIQSSDSMTIITLDRKEKTAHVKTLSADGESEEIMKYKTNESREIVVFREEDVIDVTADYVKIMCNLYVPKDKVYVI